MSTGNARGIPSVDRVLQAVGDAGLPRPLVTQEVRSAIAELRASGRSVESVDAVVAEVRERLARLERSRLRPVINGTGVLIHTNLGRAPLAPRAAEAVRQVGLHYSTLELDVESGERGRRGAFLERILAELCEAEAATVVNNCAAALVLILRHFTAGADRREVILSRGELVEIGGGFRIPEILEASGARLREVGTTNRTTVQDYRRAIGPETALLLKVHRSNFFMEGFVASAETEELAALASEHGLPLVEDLGSGAIADTAALAPVEHEPTPAEILRRGVDLVCCSGDKLFGGPQAGIIAGRADMVRALKREPFFRALRCDKLILAGLEETALAYLEAVGAGKRPALPLLAMLDAEVAGLRERAAALASRLEGADAEVRLGEGTARVGGGTMPRSAIPSVTLDIRPRRRAAQALAAALRRGPVPVIGYLEEGWLRLDLRTVFPEEDELLVGALRGELEA